MHNLLDPNISYMIGLLQTDGHHYSGIGKKGKIGLEISYRDKDIIDKISGLLECNYSIYSRERITNFSNNIKKKYISINICDFSFRSWIKKYVPIGKKSKVIKPPNDFFSTYDYWRGIIDGDGSVGVTVNNFPFIGLVTDSHDLAISYADFIKKITGQDKVINRNKRDNIYNITVFREDAQLLISKLYYKNCICIDRKKTKALEALKWKRPKSLKKRPPSKKWNKKQDNFILNHTLKECIKFLERSKMSINMRLWRLKRSEKNSI